MFIFVGILAVIFLKERLSKKILIPAILLLAGNLLLLKITSFTFTASALLIFIATLFWSVENVISKHVLKRIEPKVLAFGRLFFGSLFIMLYMLATGKFSLIAELSYAQLAWIIISTPLLFLYVLTWYSGLKHVKATTATSILLLGSPITTLLSLLFLGSALTIAQAAGILLILSGIIAMIIFLERGPYSEPTISTA
jgi:DME family drug/metabolite transporter